MAKLNRAISLIGITLLLSLATGGCSNDKSAEAEVIPAIPVKVETVQSGQVEDSSEFVGALEAAERVTLQPQASGRVEKVFVASGDRVEKGTGILALSVDQAQADVTAAQAGVGSAQAALNTAEAQLQAAQANRAKAAADLELQKADYGRTQRLVSEGALSRQQLDVAKRNLDVAQANLAAVDRQVSAARSAVSQAQAGVSQARARVDSASVGLNYKQVNAPIRGVVGTFTVKVGDFVNAGQTLTTIVQNDVLNMKIPVPSNESSKLKVGLPVELLDPNSGQEIARGSLSFVSPRVDLATQSLLAEARFDNKAGTLRDGQYVRAEIIWGESSGILVPVSAVTRIGGQGFVFVVETKEENGQTLQVATQKPVKLGNLQGDRYQILEGLQAGDTIAVSNILKLRNGLPVQPEV